MSKIIKKLNVILDRVQKAKMMGIILMMFIGAMLEALSIGIIYPVAMVVLNPEATQTNRLVSTIYQALGMKNNEQFTVVMMLALLAAFILKNLFLYLQNVVQLRFVYTNQFATSRRMMINFVTRPYEFYLNADTSVIQRNITSDVNNMYAMILSLLQLVSEAVVFALLVLVCIGVDPGMTFIMASLMLIVLFIVKVVVKPIMKKSGEENQTYYSGLFKWIDQTVIGIKEIKIANKENYFIREYAKCGEGYVKSVQKYGLYNSTPRLIIETVCIAGMVGYVIYLTSNGMDITKILPSISAFVVAATRLMPCANRINNHLTSISYFEPFFMNVSDNLQQDIRDDSVIYDEEAYAITSNVEKLPVTKNIVLKDMVYAYPNTDVLIFNHANMEIPVGYAVGIVGTSGAGKTTVVDILLGLLNLQEGGVYADGVNVKENYQGWLKNIGYIPQTIFMLDSNIRQNVAFGVSEEDMDEAKVWNALKEAQLDEFVRGLPEGLDTEIGERGIRLSGGQRQRIGIARALYENPEVLVLDEATSALDNETEAAIMESINSLHGKKTLIIIAHRLQTIEKCEMVYRVENGKVTRER